LCWIWRPTVAPAPQPPGTDGEPIKDQVNAARQVKIRRNCPRSQTSRRG
jgi:hypothetical protein